MCAHNNVCSPADSLSGKANIPVYPYDRIGKCYSVVGNQVIAIRPNMGYNECNPVPSSVAPTDNKQIESKST
jgi:hypothetical protein